MVRRARCTEIANPYIYPDAAELQYIHILDGEASGYKWITLTKEQ